MTDSPSWSRAGYWARVLDHAIFMRLREMATPSEILRPSGVGGAPASALSTHISWSRARVVRLSGGGRGQHRQRRRSQGAEPQHSRGHPTLQRGCDSLVRSARQDTRRVFLRMKSIRMNCPRVIVLVKYALPRQIADTFFTNSTRLRSRASMNVLIRIPERRHNATSRYVACRIWGSSPIEFT